MLQRQCILNHWPMINQELYYFSMINYYPKTLGMSNIENIRSSQEFVWTFKNNKQNDCQKLEHVRNIAIGWFQQLMFSVFGRELCPYFTFVSVHASNQELTKLRFEEFSENMCHLLGMENGFKYSVITKPRQAIHTGGSTECVISYDKDFFRNRLILLFDDVKTTGGSLIKYKHFFEKFGDNKVVCAVTLSETCYDLMKKHPIKQYLRA